jgi:hypothetical protein
MIPDIDPKQRRINAALDWLDANDRERTRLFGPGTEYHRQRFGHQYKVLEVAESGPEPTKPGYVHRGLGGDYPTFETWLAETKLVVHNDAHRQLLHDTWWRIFLA